MSTMELSFVEKRNLLQRQLQAQRQQLSRQWMSPPREQRRYPRSMALRFMTNRPDLLGWIKGMVLLLVGVRLYQSVQIILMLAKLVQLTSAFKTIAVGSH